MKLENEYVVMYEATREDIGEKRFYASKILQGVEEKMLISYNAESGEYIDLSQFKLIYTDKEQKHLMGSLKNVPTEEDIHLSIYDVDGNLVFGCNDVPPVPPTPKHIVTVNPIENCVTGGSGEYEEGANVKVTIKPAEGYMFGDGNEPKIGEDYMNLDEGQGWFYKDIVMGTEDIEVTIEGVVVEEKPANGYWFAPEEEADKIEDNWNKLNSVAYPEQVVVYPGSAEVNYPAFAIKQSLGELAAIYQPAQPSTDLLNGEDSSWKKLDVVYKGELYYLYTFKESHLEEADDEFDFCFLARN